MGQIAERFRIPKGTARNVLERFRVAGTVAPQPHNAGRRPVFSATVIYAVDRQLSR